MATVCIGPEFSVDDAGRLRARMCGNPPAQAWPYPCTAADANPLRYDEACGLWLPPYPKVAVVSAQGSTSNVYTNVPAAFTMVANAAITIDNPSACYPAMVFRFVNVDINWGIPPGDARVSARVDGNTFLSFENPAPLSGGSLMNGSQWEYVQPLQSGSLIPPGASQTYAAPIEVGEGQGGSQYGQIFWYVRALVFMGLQ